MRKEVCSQESDHQWVCRYQEGIVGEITKSQPLTEAEISRVRQDTEVALLVCPNGVIVCSKCEIPLVPNQDTQPKPFDIEDLRKQIIGN